MINYIEESYYPTVEELLKLPIFPPATLLPAKGDLTVLFPVSTSATIRIMHSGSLLVN